MTYITCLEKAGVVTNLYDQITKKKWTKLCNCLIQTPNTKCCSDKLVNFKELIMWLKTTRVTEPYPCHGQKQTSKQGPTDHSNKEFKVLGGSDSPPTSCSYNFSNKIDILILFD